LKQVLEKAHGFPPVNAEGYYNTIIHIIPHQRKKPLERENPPLGGLRKGMCE
jgi:hypothetical protein